MAEFKLPIGLQLNQAARTVGRAFDAALAEAGGSLPVWIILLNLMIRQPGNQRELAEAVGLREATLTHHLNAMDTQGLITRTRSPGNRRVHVVEMTKAGKSLFGQMQQAAMAFDTRLREGLAQADLDTLSALLTHLSKNVGGDPEASLWPGLPDR
jgi:MarR family transcriptional regulator, transcriptional regulator for hemolysin